MTLRILGVLAATGGIAADIVLFGQATRPHLSDGDELGLDLFNSFFELLNRHQGLHITPILFTPFLLLTTRLSYLSHR